MAEIISAGVHRPRNVDWKRAAALLTAIGVLASVRLGWHLSRPFRIVSDHSCRVRAHGNRRFNYIIVCAHFPMAGRLFCARQQSRF